MKNDRNILFLTVLIGLILISQSLYSQETRSIKGIHINDENPWYWQYQGEPVLLIGGSNDDNLFQWGGKRLTDHLDLMVSSGGNYVRNTMSDRDESNVYAFKKEQSGKYNLDEWNTEYWDKLTFFLEETQKREIIVQLTLWDKFDIGPRQWESHPFNPALNNSLESSVWKGRDDFYLSILNESHKGLYYQKRFIDKLMNIAFSYDHILYNINNESSESGEWENYWPSISKNELKKIKKIYVTNMQLSAFNALRHVMSKTELFDFVDVSQVNQDSKGARGPAHWDYLMFLREKVQSFGPIPMNNVKIYGGTDGSTNFSAGSETEAIDRFWRDIFGGCASARFHRPSVPNKVWGSGLNDRVQTNLKAMNLVLDKIDIFSCSPHNDLITPVVPVPSMMQAYVTADIGKQYAVYFPQGRYRISLDPWVYCEQIQVEWLDIENLKWSQPERIPVHWTGGKDDWGYQGSVILETPSNRQCVAVLTVIED